ncbi:MAG TPA: S8 family serine peptidase [Candidatus Limnocylindrales bacterium]|nr:S8 family serine peptidase [Candidatus Limnocylindrales bacterium]
MSFSALPSFAAGKEFTAGPGESFVPDQLLIRLEPGADINSVLSQVPPGIAARALSAHHNSFLLTLPKGLQNVLSKALAALPSVIFVEPNRIRTVNLSTPNDPSYSSQWALTNIQALQAWNLMPDQFLTASTAGANRVKVAVLDTGVDCTHPDFRNAGGTSADSAQGGQILFSASSAPVPTTVSPAVCPWQDDQGHGTHTAGTIAAATGNGTGVASVGYPLQLIVYKVLDSSGSGNDALIATAIESATDAGAKVISMSLGGAGYSQSLQEAMDYAWAHDTLVVAAAGNTGDTTLEYPGAGNHGIGVAATDTSNARASFSTYGNWTKIAAPGVGILSTLPTYSNSYGISYGSLSGTSMATPHVAAVAGLIAMGNPGLSAAAIAQRLQQSAQSTSTTWDQYLGYGVLNAAGAVSGTLRPGSLGSLVGQVLSSSGVAVAGAIVTGGGKSFTTASDGLFRLPNLAAGTYTVTVTASGYSALSVQAAVVQGADTMLAPHMGSAQGEFTGQVQHNGMPMAGASVEANSGGANVATATTDANGSYALYVAPGTYSLTASNAGAVTSTVTAQSVASGGVTSVNIPLSTLGNITGVVKDSSGALLAGARVDISGAFTAGATTDSSGNFSSIGLPSATYSVTASATGYNPAVQSGVAVNANASTFLTLIFNAGPPVISAASAGSVTSSGATITWVTNRPADSQVNYGLSSSYGYTTPLDSTLVTTHSVALTGLAPSSTYHYQILTRDSQGLLGASADLFFTTLSSPGTQLLQLHLDSSEVNAVTNGSTVTPAVAPPGLTGKVQVSGTGSVNFTSAQSGNGVYFLNCCVNTNNAYYKFTGAGVGTAFNTDQGQITFYLKSRYSFTQRKSSASGPRYAFDVRDASTHQFYFLTQVSSGYLEFVYTIGGSSQYYFVPVGTEDTLFGSGVTAKVTLAWNSASGTGTLALNDKTVKTTSYVKSTPSWTSASVFDLGAYEYGTSGGYYSEDDIIDEFSVVGPAQATDAVPPVVSITAPGAGATVSSVVTVAANATDNVGVTGVQFELDGAKIGGAQSGAGPTYSISWDTTTASNGPHTLSAVASDAAGNSATASNVAITVNNVSPPPVISAVNASPVTYSGATISWTTDTLSDSQVAYGTTSSYGSISPLNSTLVTSHSVSLGGLTASTTYHYQVMSRDSQGNLVSSADFTFTTAAAPVGPQPLLLLHADASEVSGTTAGAIVTPSAGPAGFTGNVVVNGTGSVNFATGQSGNGLYFLNCCGNTNNAYYKFTGTPVGSIFNVAQGQITFYLKSRYTFAQRTASAATPRYAFDVRDASSHQFYFLTQVSSGYLEFVYNIGGAAQYYFVPAGTEEALFGSGVTVKVTLTWDGSAGAATLFLNDKAVKTTAYKASAPSWTAASVFDFGAYEYLTHGGYYSLDDIIDEFTVTGPASGN